MKKEIDSKIKYFVYCRKSFEDKEKQALSIPAQIEKIKIAFGSLDIIHCYEEEKSAFIPYNRPKFAEMIERIQQGEAQGIVSWHPDRMSRNEIDAASITYLVRTGIIKDLKFCTFNFENTPEGIWMLQMALSQSQYDSAKKGRDVIRGMETKVKMGWKPGVANEGYLNDKTKDKGERTIYSDPERFTLLRKAWDMLLTGSYTVSKIQDVLNNKWGYKTVKRKRIGGTPISISTLYAMFGNPFYAGLIRYKGELHKGSHEAMITLEEFDTAQILLGRKGRPRPKTHEFAFTGHIRCPECGAAYTAEAKTKIIKSTGKLKSWVYYHCTRRKKGIKCSNSKSIEEQELKANYFDELSKITIKPEFRDWALEVLNSQNDAEIESRTKIYDMQHKTLVNTQTELDNLSRMFYRGLIKDESFFVKERDRLEAEILKMEGSLRDTEVRAKKWLDLTVRTFNFATYAKINFDKGDIQTKKEIFAGLGENFVIRNGKLEYDLFEWFEPIRQNYPALEQKFNALELENNSSLKSKKQVLSDLRLAWLRRSDSNRQHLR